MGNAEGSAQFPYNIGDEVTNFTGNTIWKLYHGKKKTGGDPVSIFSFDKKNSTNNDHLSVAQNCLKRLKTLRHPNVLKFIDGVELTDTLYIVTEAVEPFEFHKKHDEDGSGRKQKNKIDTITLGLSQLTSTLTWLHNDCGMIHGNVQPSSLFLTKTGDWKLAGFGVCTPLSNLSSQGNDTILLPLRYQSPSLQSRSWSSISNSPVHALDAWSLGCFIFECFNGEFNRKQDLLKTQDIPRKLIPQYKNLLSNTSRRRLSPAKFLKSKFFSNPVVQSVNFLDNLALKTKAEKETFFKQFPSKVDQIPDHCAKYKILPQLIQALEYGSGISCFTAILTAVLKIGAGLTEDEYNTLVIPSVVKLFSSNERAIRVHLLQHLKEYHENLGADLINKDIFPSVMSGFSDSSGVLRELTVKSMPYLVPKLDAKTVDSKVMKSLVQTQSDSEPAIRTNTTYCLAKIAPSLSAETRNRYLLSCFCRGLQDNFPPARQAALQSIIATHKYYSSEECVQKLIGLISQRALDNVESVRETALQCLSSLLDKFRAHHQELIKQKLEAKAFDPAQEPNMNSLGGTIDQDTGVIANVAGSAAGMAGSIGSWAVSSITGAVKSRLPGRDSTSEEKDKKISASEYKQKDPYKKISSSENKRQDIYATATSPAKINNKRKEKTSKINKITKEDDWNDDFFNDDFDDAPMKAMKLSTKPKTIKQKTSLQRSHQIPNSTNTHDVTQRKFSSKFAVDDIDESSDGFGGMGEDETNILDDGWDSWNSTGISNISSNRSCNNNNHNNANRNNRSSSSSSSSNSSSSRSNSAYKSIRGHKASVSRNEGITTMSSGGQISRSRHIGSNILSNSFGDPNLDALLGDMDGFSVSSNKKSTAKLGIKSTEITKTSVPSRPKSRTVARKIPQNNSHPKKTTRTVQKKVKGKSNAQPSRNTQRNITKKTKTKSKSMDDWDDFLNM